MRAGIESMVARSSNRNAVENLTWKDLIERGYVVAGSPESVTQQLENLADKMHVGHLMVLCQYGDMSKETTMYNTTRFAKEVMPKLRNKFSEYEDKWWPTQTLEDMAVPAPLTTLV
jgi:alkanesulfonate monooxygenase SsuD/methylene tetrahydromethanopterin reductase-like flavin-dependent oxidoreductase (luciferase family)